MIADSDLLFLSAVHDAILYFERSSPPAPKSSIARHLKGLLMGTPILD